MSKIIDLNRSVLEFTEDERYDWFIKFCSIYNLSADEESEGLDFFRTLCEFDVPLEKAIDDSISIFLR